MLDHDGAYSFGCALVNTTVSLGGVSPVVVKCAPSDPSNQGACRALTAADDGSGGQADTTCITGVPPASAVGISGQTCEDFSTYVSNQDQCNFEGMCTPSTGWAYCYERKAPPPSLPPPASPPPSSPDSDDDDDDKLWIIGAVLGPLFFCILVAVLGVIYKKKSRVKTAPALDSGYPSPGGYQTKTSSPDAY